MSPANSTGTWFGMLNIFRANPTSFAYYFSMWIMYAFLPFLVLYRGGPTLLASVEAYKKAFDRLFEIGPEIEAKATRVVRTIRVMSDCFWFGLFNVLISPLTPIWYCITTLPYQFRYYVLVTKMYFKGFSGPPVEFVLDPEDDKNTQSSGSSIPNSSGYYSRVKSTSRDEISLEVPEYESSQMTQMSRPRIMTEWR